MSLSVKDVIHTWPTMRDRVVLDGEISLENYALIEPGTYVVRARIRLIPGTRTPGSGAWFVAVYRHGVRVGTYRETADRARSLDIFNAYVSEQRAERRAS